MRGQEATTVAHVVARAHVSRTTFFITFTSLEACFAAVFEESVAHIADVAATAYAGDGDWPERLRTGLLALLALLEREPDVGAFVLSHLTADRSLDPKLRWRVLGRLCSALERGRSQPGAPANLSPLTEEFVVGGVLAVIHARVRECPSRLSELANQLMWMIVLPYLGPGAAAKQLRRALPEPVASRPAPARGAFDELDMRLTYRTARALAAIAEHPGASNTQIAAWIGVADQAQISRLLARIAHLGLVENTASHSAGSANAWRLTPRGSEIDSALRRRLAHGRRGPGGRSHG